MEYQKIIENLRKRRDGTDDSSFTNSIFNINSDLMLKDSKPRQPLEVEQMESQEEEVDGREVRF